jgi:hypothetical protein
MNMLKNLSNSPLGQPADSGTPPIRRVNVRRASQDEGANRRDIGRQRHSANLHRLTRDDGAFGKHAPSIGHDWAAQTRVVSVAGAVAQDNVLALGITDDEQAVAVVATVTVMTGHGGAFGP